MSSAWWDGSERVFPQLEEGGRVLLEAQSGVIGSKHFEQLFNDGLFAIVLFRVFPSLVEQVAADYGGELEEGQLGLLLDKPVLLVFVVDEAELKQEVAYQVFPPAAFQVGRAGFAHWSKRVEELESFFREELLKQRPAGRVRQGGPRVLFKSRLHVNHVENCKSVRDVLSEQVNAQGVNVH